MNTIRWRKLSTSPWTRWGVTLGLLALVTFSLARDLDWHAVWQAVHEADYRWVALGMLAIVSTFFSRAWRWQALLHRTSARLRSLLMALLVGQAAGLIMTSQGGYVVRAMWLNERETGAAEALGSIAVEKLWDLLALLVCGLLLLWWGPTGNWFRRSTGGTAILLAIGTAGVWAGLHWQATLFDLFQRLFRHLPPAWGAAMLPRAQRMAQGLDSLRHPRASLRAFAGTVLTWGLGVAANWAVLQAFGIHSWSAALFLQAALMLGGAAVPLPGRLGIFEGTCVASLALYGIPPDLALAVGLTLHLVVMGPPLLMVPLLQSSTLKAG